MLTALCAPALLGACSARSAENAPASAAPPPPAWTTAAVTAPGVSYRTFDSAAAGTRVSFHIYLPPAYYAEPARRFPVLYWLHGSGGGLAGISPMARRFDAAIAAGRVPPFLVVFPNGMEHSMWVDSRDGRIPMETVVVKDLIAHVDATFRTQADRNGRAIEGFSMGGYGAARFAFKFTALFASVSMLGAGPMQSEFTADVGPPALAQTRIRVLNTAYGGDQEYFKANSPWLLAEVNAQALRAGSLIRQAIGTFDRTLPANREFHERLMDLAVPHTYLEVPGVSHDPPALIDAMGETYWGFHRAAFAAAVNPPR
jgi:S-formylglutathione hydrolase FrmB